MWVRERIGSLLVLSRPRGVCANGIDIGEDYVGAGGVLLIMIVLAIEAE